MQNDVKSCVKVCVSYRQHHKKQKRQVPYYNISTQRFIFLSGIRESNPPPRLGKPVHYRCANPAKDNILILLNRATSGTRTRDPRITNALLYQLSHHGMAYF